MAPVSRTWDGCVGVWQALWLDLMQHWCVRMKKGA